MILPTIHFLIRYFFQHFFHYHQITYFYINIYTKFNSTKKKKKKLYEISKIDMLSGSISLI